MFLYFLLTYILKHFKHIFNRSHKIYIRWIDGLFGDWEIKEIYFVNFNNDEQAKII